VQENDGFVGLADVEEWTERLGLESARQARRLIEDWELRGWLEKDVTAGNKRKVTAELMEAAGMALGQKS
jgi:hypothetical protein